MAKKGTLYMIACLLFASASWADYVGDSRTLDSLVQVGLRRNPGIHAVEYRHGAAEHESKYAGWLPDPQFTAGILNLPRTSFNFDQTPMTGVSLSLSQSFPWPGKLSARADIARLNSKSKSHSLAAQRNSIVRLVTNYYYDYSYWTLAADILTENSRLVQNIIDVTQIRYANGLGSAQDVLRTQTAKARLGNRILMARQRRSSALVRLGLLTDNPETVHASPRPALPPILFDAPEVLTDISNPVLAQTSLRATIAERRLALARSDYWPDLTFGIDYRIRRDTPMDPVRGEDFLSFKVSTTIPLWFFARQRNQTAAAKQSFLAAQAEERAATSIVEQQVADILLALHSLAERIKQYDQSILPQARAASEAARVAYEVGHVDFNGFLSAQLEVMDVELERLELLRQHHRQAAVLHELTAGVQEVKQ